MGDENRSYRLKYTRCITLIIIVWFLFFDTPQALPEINEHKGKLQSVQELSTHLLYLEPIFDGKPVRDDLQMLGNHFQNLVMEVFTLLETQVNPWQRIDLLIYNSTPVGDYNVSVC